MYKGMIVDVIYGLDFGNKYEIITEPYSIDVKNTQVVDMKSMFDETVIQVTLQNLEEGVYYKLSKENLLDKTIVYLRLERLFDTLIKYQEVQKQVKENKGFVVNGIKKSDGYYLSTPLLGDVELKQSDYFPEVNKFIKLVSLTDIFLYKTREALAIIPSIKVFKLDDSISIAIQEKNHPIISKSNLLSLKDKTKDDWIKMSDLPSSVVCSLTDIFSEVNPEEYRIGRIFMNYINGESDICCALYSYSNIEVLQHGYGGGEYDSQLKEIVGFTDSLGYSVEEIYYFIGSNFNFVKRRLKSDGQYSLVIGD